MLALENAGRSRDAVDFARHWLSMRGGHPLEESEARARCRAQLRKRANPFTEGRRHWLSTLRAAKFARHDAELFREIWRDWQEEEPKEERTAVPPGGFEVLTREALAAAARAAGLAPSVLKARGFMQTAQKEWEAMPCHEQLLYSSAARLQPRPAPPAVRECESRAEQQLPLLPSDLEWSTPSPQIYGQGSDATFAHPLVKSLLRHARKRVSFGLDWVICVRTFGRSGGKGGICSLTLKILEELGVERRRLHIFVAFDDPEFIMGRYEKALGDLAERIIVGVRGADLQVRFIEESFPPGQHVVVCDDNLVSLSRLSRDTGAGVKARSENSELVRLNLEEQIQEAARQMAKHQAHLWGISPTHNLIYLKNSLEMKLGLGLIYGAFFGFICLHEPELFTQHGQVKDDLERTLRYWRRDYVLIRFGRIFCKKNYKPGAFHKHKGGISASLGGARHGSEAKEALKALSKTFRRYIRLPCSHDQKTKGSGELVFLSDESPAWKVNVSGCGVVFKGSPLDREVPPSCALRGSFFCPVCRRRPERPGCYCVRPEEEEAWLCFKEEAQAALQELAPGAVDWQRFMLAARKEWVLAEKEDYEMLAAKKLEKEQWKRLPKRQPREKS